MIEFYSNAPFLIDLRRRIATRIKKENISKIDASDLVEQLVVVEKDHDEMKASFIAALERSEVLNVTNHKEGKCDQFICSVRKYGEDSTITICMAELRKEKMMVEITYHETVFDFDKELALKMYRKLTKSR